MMVDVFLYGSLKQKYGREFRFDISTPIEAFRALQANFRDFYNTIRPGRFKVVLGDLQKGEQLDIERMTMCTGTKPLHIVPVVAGGKDSKGIVTFVLGVAIIATSIAVPAAAGAFAGGFSEAMASTVALPVLGDVAFGKIAMLGAALALGGISQLMAQQPRQNNYNSQSQTSWLFGSPTNRAEQGTALPVIAGRWKAGSIPVSGGISVMDTVGGVPVDQLVRITAEGESGTINPAGSMQVRIGSDVAFTIRSPGWPYAVSDVVVDGVSIGPVDSYTFHNVSGNHNIRVILGYASPDYDPTPG